MTTSATWVVPLPTMPLLGDAEGVPWLTDSVCGPRLPHHRASIRLQASNTKASPVSRRIAPP